jgi:hypothetical protein
LVEEKIEPEVAENMRTWQHSGFSVDQSVFLPAGDQAGIERLIQYMTRCPFSLSRLVKVSDAGQIVYQAEKQACRAFPDPKGDGTQAGVKRNFQILPPLDFLAEFAQHLPAKGSHLIRYYGWYSNKSRGMRRKAEMEATAEASTEDNASAVAGTRSSQTWAMLIKRVYEVDPLCCPQCGGEMKVVAFLEPPQREVIEKILLHCGLWQASSPRAPPDVDGLVLDPDAAYSDSAIGSLDQADQSQELTSDFSNCTKASFSQVGRADFGGDGIIAWLARIFQSQSNWLDTFSHGWAIMIWIQRVWLGTGGPSGMRCGAPRLGEPATGTRA